MDIWKSANYHVYDTFVDIFSGSMTVGVNMLPKANKIICNDTQRPLIMLYEALCNIPWEEVNAFLLKQKERITGKNDFEWFDDIAKEYNGNPQKNILDVLLLSHCCYNGILPFNELEFIGRNGKRLWGNRFIRIVKEFHAQLFENKTKFSFMSIPFQNIDYKQFGENDLLYFDPPYFVTNAFYNHGWKYEHELKLYGILDELNSRNVKWMLSNATCKGTRKNYVLLNWLQGRSYHSYEPTIDYAGDQTIHEILVYNFSQLSLM